MKMKSLFSKFKYLFFILFFLHFLELKAENYPLEKITNQNNEFLIESNSQRSDLENSIFYAEGDVIITNTNKEFIAKSQKAIFYKLTGKIKLIGNVEVIKSDSDKLKAGEIIYSVTENKFEAIADDKQRVNTKFVFNENKILN